MNLGVSFLGIRIDVVYIFGSKEEVLMIILRGLFAFFEDSGGCVCG